MSGTDQWITFDCYGTLLDWQSAFRTILAPVSAGRVDELVAAFHTFEPDVEREFATSSYRAVLRESVRRAAASIDLEVADADLDLLPNEWHTMRAFPDTSAALNALIEQGWQLGILTNCDDDLFESTRAALGAPIDVVVTAEQVGSYKPGPGHFTEFEARTGVDRTRWVHAGVSWWHDMVPAHDLGLRSVWVDREKSGHDPSIVTRRVTSMADLAEAAADLHLPP